MDGAGRVGRIYNKQETPRNVQNSCSVGKQIREEFLNRVTWGGFTDTVSLSTDLNDTRSDPLQK